MTGTTDGKTTDIQKLNIADLPLSKMVQETEASIAAMYSSVLSAASKDIAGLSQNLSKAAGENAELQSLTASMIADLQARVKATLPDQES